MDKFTIMELSMIIGEKVFIVKIMFLTITFS